MMPVKRGQSPLPRLRSRPLNPTPEWFLDEMRRRKAEHVALQELIEWNAEEIERLEDGMSHILSGAYLTRLQLRDLEDIFKLAGELAPWQEAILDTLRGDVI